MIEVTDTARFEIDDEGMYGIESAMFKKHVWELGKSVVYGALVHDRETGHQFFVTAADLERYRTELKVDL